MVPTFLFSHCQQERHCVTLQSNLGPAPTLPVLGARASFHLIPPLSKSSAWNQRVRQRSFRNVPARTKCFLLYSLRAQLRENGARRPPSGPPGLRGAWQKLLTPGDWLERGGSMSSLVPACDHQASGQGAPFTKSLPNLGPFLLECVEGGVV